MPIAKSKICSKDSLSFYSKHGSTSRRPLSANIPLLLLHLSGTQNWEKTVTSPGSWRDLSPVSVTGKDRSGFRSPMKSRQQKGTLSMMSGRSLAGCLLGRTSDSPRWGIAHFIYHPVTSYVPSKKKKKKKKNLLAQEAERQSLCIDVIFQSNNS